MRTKNTAFYRGNKEVLVDFSAGEISSDGAVILLEKLERKNKLIKYFSSFITDNRDPSRIQHTTEKLLKQRVFMQVQGYEDTNDVGYLKNDPLFKDVLQGQMASQPTLSRFENSFDKATIFEFCYAWIDRYVDSLKGRKKIIIDIVATDDNTHVAHQMTMFNLFYNNFINNLLFFHLCENEHMIFCILH